MLFYLSHLLSLDFDLCIQLTSTRSIHSPQCRRIKATSQPNRYATFLLAHKIDLKREFRVIFCVVRMIGLLIWMVLLVGFWNLVGQLIYTEMRFLFVLLRRFWAGIFHGRLTWLLSLYQALDFSFYGVTIRNLRITRLNCLMMYCCLIMIIVTSHRMLNFKTYAASLDSVISLFIRFYFVSIYSADTLEPLACLLCFENL